MEFPSKLLENLVYNISQLSGIGKRSALRIALEILRKPKEFSRDLSESIFDFKTQIKHRGSNKLATIRYPIKYPMTT